MHNGQVKSESKSPKWQKCLSAQFPVVVTMPLLLLSPKALTCVYNLCTSTTACPAPPHVLDATQPLPFFPLLSLWSRRSFNTCLSTWTNVSWKKLMTNQWEVAPCRVSAAGAVLWSIIENHFQISVLSDLVHFLFHSVFSVRTAVE